MYKIFTILILSTSINCVFSANTAEYEHIIQPDTTLIDKTHTISTDSIWPRTSNKYYDDYSNMLGLFFYGKQKYSSFSITDPLKNKTIEYTPNTQLNMGLGFNYKWLGIGLAFNFGFVNNDDNIYGKTTRLDLQTNIYLDKAVFDFYLQNYQGFYVNNPASVFSGWEGGDDTYIRPDIQSSTIGISGLYIFNNKRFSYKSAFKQTAIQKKSAGSFMLGASAVIRGFTADSSIFPTNSDFATLKPITANAGFYIGVLTAYGYNFNIRKHYFLSLSMTFSIHMGKTAYLFEDGTGYEATTPIAHLQPRMAFGYNKPRWYAGLSFVRDSYFEGDENGVHNLDLEFNSGNFRFFVGMRFNKFARKNINRR